jgi:hypothetical protein
MLKKLSIALFSLLAASGAQAAAISCSTASSAVVQNGITITASFNCNPGAGAVAGAADDNLAGDGWDVTRIRLRLAGLFDEVGLVAGSSYAFAVSTGNTLGISNPSCTVFATASSSGSAAGSCTTLSPFLDLNPIDFISPFTVTVTGSAQGPSLLPWNGEASLWYEVVAQPSAVQQVPEPATLAMAALALLSMGAARRRT